jgi:small subunit ribosomal protein S8
MYHVGDFIIRVKNAYRARRQQLVMPYSSINKAVAGVLVKKGFLAKVEEGEDKGHKQLVVSLRYENRKPAMHDVVLISKPSLRIYIDKQTIAADKDKAMTAIVSTSSGIMTGKDALKKGVGGELLFKIW